MNRLKSITDLEQGEKFWFLNVPNVDFEFFKRHSVLDAMFVKPYGYGIVLLCDTTDMPYVLVEGVRKQREGGEDGN